MVVRFTLFARKDHYFLYFLGIAVYSFSLVCYLFPIGYRLRRTTADVIRILPLL